MHFLNADSLICVTFVGMSILFNDEQFEKHDLPMILTCSPISIFFNDEHPENE